MGKRANGFKDVCLRLHACGLCEQYARKACLACAAHEMALGQGRGGGAILCHFWLPLGTSRGPAWQVYMSGKKTQGPAKNRTSQVPSSSEIRPSNNQYTSRQGRWGTLLLIITTSTLKVEAPAQKQFRLLARSFLRTIDMFRNLNPAHSGVV